MTRTATPTGLPQGLVGHDCDREQLPSATAAGPKGLTAHKLDVDRHPQHCAEHSCHHWCVITPRVYALPLTWQGNTCSCLPGYVSNLIGPTACGPAILPNGNATGAAGLAAQLCESYSRHFDMMMEVSW